MQVTNISHSQNPVFKNGFYNVTTELNSSVMLSRALVDACGCTIPWIVMANNGTERKEKARRFLFDYAVIYMTPFLTLPFTNRLAMKHIGKLTKNLWSNNHKAVHISNEFLKDTGSMMQGLHRISKKTDRGPFEVLFNKINPNKRYKQVLNIDELLKSCDGDKEKLRQKIIKSKKAIFVSDYILTFGTLGTIPFLNNEITKNTIGQSGFSAEMSMADKSVVEKRAEHYEKTKKKKYLAFLGILGAEVLGLSLAAFTTLNSKNSGKFINYLKNNAKSFDYNKGIYMSRLPLFLGFLTTLTANALASRNNTERKDIAIRQGIGSAVFFGGDLLLASLFTNMSDRLFGTKLRKGDNNSFFRKIFPSVKSIKQVIEEVESGKIQKCNKSAAAGIFWASMLLLMGAMGYLMPKAINKMIKQDVDKEVKYQKSDSN